MTKMEEAGISFLGMCPGDFRNTLLGLSRPGKGAEMFEELVNELPAPCDDVKGTIAECVTNDLDCGRQLRCLRNNREDLRLGQVGPSGWVDRCDRQREWSRLRGLASAIEGMDE